MLNPRRRPRAFAAVVATLIVVAGIVAAVVVLTRRPGNVSHPGVPFVSSTPAPATTPLPERRKVSTFSWPLYGYSKDHNRDFQPAHPLHGPWHMAWRYRAHALLEFPPVIGRGRIVQLADDGRLAALDLRTGKIRWRKRLGTLAASTPALGHGVVYVTLLQGDGAGVGRVAALRAKNGHVIWSRGLPSRSESSPLLDHGRLYLGSEDGTVYCLNARNGHVKWTYHAAGAVKGSPTLADGKLYFGDYGGRVQAIRASDGHVVWQSTAGGTVYATAAVAFGRVYVGSTDGRVYSFSTSNGALAWAHQTGAYVYSSSAVRDVPHLGPTVYVGSYSGTFFALNARTGGVRWSYTSGGKISGSPTVIGDTVYFSDLGKQETYGLSARTGRLRFHANYGAFDPAVSDGQRLYITGHGSLTALERKQPRKHRKRAKRPKHHP